MTKEEKREYKKQYKEANKEKIKEYNKKYKEANKEKIKEYNREYKKQYREANKEKIKKQKKEYYEANKDKVKEYYEANKDKIKEYREANKEKFNDYQKKYAKANQKKIKEYREANKHIEKKYKEANKEKIAKYQKQYSKDRYHSDPLFKFKANCRTRTYIAFKANSWKKNGGTEKLLGCDYKTAMNHIESQFVGKNKWMNWDNHGEWHIDHKIPLASANTKEEMTPLFHYTNLQPLLAEENMGKSDKILN